MKVIGLTGGIGSGKTTVSKMFEALGVPVYIADIEAKKLMHSSKVIRRKLTALFGEKAYVNDELNRAYIAAQVFTNKPLLEQLNKVVHPKVKQHFNRWLKKQTAPYVIKEAAIIFEEGMQDQFNAVILVTAHKETRIKRLLKRDRSTRTQILQRMRNQLPDATKIKWADYVIENSSLESTKNQVATLHQMLLTAID